MISLILQTATRYLVPLLLLFSLFLLEVGHNEPGGGFVGGLVAAAALSLFAIAYDVKTARNILPIHPIQLIGLGLLLAAVSGLFGLADGQEFLKGIWIPDESALPHLGTPSLFDLGVYFVVIGITILIVFTLMEQEEETNA